MISLPHSEVECISALLLALKEQSIICRALRVTRGMEPGGWLTAAVLSIVNGPPEGSGASEAAGEAWRNLVLTYAGYMAWHHLFFIFERTTPELTASFQDARKEFRQAAKAFGIKVSE